MGAYLALRIQKGKLDYDTVITKFPQYQDEVNEILRSNGFVIGEDGAVVKNEE